MLKSIKIENYKCFRQTEEIVLGDNWTVIVGQNNSGKSTFLNCCTLKEFRNTPYRGLSTEADIVTTPVSKLRFKFRLSGKQVRKLMYNGENVVLPISRTDVENFDSTPAIMVLKDRFEKILLIGHIQISGDVLGNNNYSNFRLKDQDGTELFPSENVTVFGKSVSNTLSMLAEKGAFGGTLQLQNWIVSAINSTFYAFHAERLNIGRHAVGPVTTLEPNGRNLAQVLLTLLQSPNKFQEYVHCVSRVLPNILQICPTQIANNEVELKIAFHEAEVERDDLLFSLAECGTGVSQVLCILYVAVTSREPTTILIDEPNSFLHPGASKKLIEVLKTYSQHQYIISTHSPELIQTADPEQLIMIKWKPDGSEVKTIDRAKVNDIRYALGDLGVNLSDVFGHDKVIWVEGQTEASTFPLLLAKAQKRLLSGIAFVPLRTTGEVTGKQKETFFDIYDAVTKTNNVLPSALAYSLDSENLSETKKVDINKRSGGITKFLPRKTFENYLLHSKAISALLIENNVPVTEDEVERYLAGELPEGETQETVNGAKLLSGLFKHFSNSDREYRKILHGTWLVTWLLENDEAFLKELSEYVVELAEGNFTEIKAVA